MHSACFSYVCACLETQGLTWSSQAEINIRKGKKLAVFEVAAKAEYEAWNGEAVERGTLEIVEVYQDDMDEDFDVSWLRTGPECAAGGHRCPNWPQHSMFIDSRRTSQRVRASAQVRFAVTHPVDGLNTRALRIGPLAQAVRAVVRQFANKLPDMDGGEAALAEAKVSATRRESRLANSALPSTRPRRGPGRAVRHVSAARNR